MNKNIILFGASTLGKKAFEVLKDHYAISAFWDNNEKLWGTFMCGIQVKQPQNQIGENELIVVSSSFVSAIVNHLTGSNIQNYTIFTVEPNSQYKLVDYNEWLRIQGPWNEDWTNYYHEAEGGVKEQYEKLIHSIGMSQFKQFDFSTTLDFACGYGRMASLFSQYAKKLICSDINSRSIEYCRDRFVPIINSEIESIKDKHVNRECNFSFVVNSMDRIPVDDSSLSFIYSWDAMVHFDKTTLKLYVGEFYRLLKTGGAGFIHHSNLGNLSIPQSVNYKENRAWRAQVKSEEVKVMLENQGFKILSQTLIPWDGLENMDCISVFQKI